MIFKYLSYIFDRKINLNNLSHIPGSWIDDLYVTPQTLLLGRAWRVFKSKLIFYAFFPPLAALNTLTNGLTSLYYLAATRLTKDAAKKRAQWIKFNNSLDACVKNFIGLICFPISIYFTREYSFLFVAPAPTKNLLVAGGSYASLSTQIKYPNSTAVVKKNY